MANKQLVAPNLRASDGAGWCLRFTQRVYQNRNPHFYASAWDAWLNPRHRGSGGIPSDVSVPVYFSHWGTYGGKYANWGHIVAWVPGKGYLSSPTHGEGGQWFPNIGAVERAFNAKYVGWAYDVGGLKVAEPASKPAAKPKPTPAPKPTPKPTPAVAGGKGDKMFMIALPKGAPNKKDTLFAVVGSQFWLEFSGQAAANNLIRQITGTDKFSALTVSESFWNSCKNR